MHHFPRFVGVLALSFLISGTFSFIVLSTLQLKLILFKKKLKSKFIFFSFQCKVMKSRNDETEYLALSNGVETLFVNLRIAMARAKEKSSSSSSASSASSSSSIESSVQKVHDCLEKILSYCHSNDLIKVKLQRFRIDLK